MSKSLQISWDPAQLSGAVVGMIAGWTLALAILSNGWLNQPLAIVAGVAGGMLVGWAVWLAISLSLFLARQGK